MFGTAIHWTTFFYLLLDIAIVAISLYLNPKLHWLNLRRYIILGCLFISYNLSGGFLPDDDFLKPIIIQYVITYGIAISLCIYIIYYLYKEFEIVLLKKYFSVRNISITLIIAFILLFLLPYLISGSLNFARLFFTIPVFLLGITFLIFFYQRISFEENQNDFFKHRKKLSTFTLGCIVLLPFLTVIGDYQWLTFTVMNLGFYAITALEFFRYNYLLKNRIKLEKILTINQNIHLNSIREKIVLQNLTKREFEISLLILSRKSYRQIANNLFIAEKTVSKHASNIFKKTGVKNKKEFLQKYSKNT